MKNQPFTEISIIPLGDEDIVQEIAKQLEKARQIGAANELDEILTGISARHDYFSSHETCFGTFVALFPKPSLIDCKLFEQQQGLFTGPYLSELTHVFSGKDIRTPEKVLVHVRSKKTFQGNEQVSVAHAGYVKYGQHPSETAEAEFKEELKKFSDIKPIFVEHDGNGLKETEKPARCLDITIHYMGPSRIRNPVVGFIQYVEPRTAERYPTVTTLAELDSLCIDTKDFEVLGVAWVPYKQLGQFWTEVAKADRVYSISRESTMNFKSFFDNLS